MNQAPQASLTGGSVSTLRISICILLAFLTLAAYWDVQRNEFVLYDDQSYITQNPHVRAGITLDGVRWAFSSSHSFNWHPLTWLSHMLDVELYGLHPAGHHWNSLLLHLCNTLLLFLLLHKMTGSLWRSGLAAALFSLHPLHVESVAWASERKDLLSTFFWLSSLLAYTRYVRRPGAGRYLPALLLFAFGLMSKPMVVTLPIVLLLLDFWPLKRFRPGETGRAGVLRLCREKIPFFVLSALSCVVTYLVQRESGAVAFELPFGMRLSNALVSYTRYVFKMFWPVDLACFYPHPVDSLETWQTLGSLLFLILATLFAFRFRRSRPWWVTGWLWYLITLVPVIGLVQVGEQAIADRYTYIPLIGLFVGICWSIPSLMSRAALLKPAAGILSAALLFALLLATREQTRHWRDSLSLFQHEVRVNAGSFLAHFHLAMALEELGRPGDAAAEYEHSLRIRPGFQLGHFQLANVYMRTGRTEEAMRQYSISIGLDPRDYRSHTNLGLLLQRDGKTAEAVRHFTEALRIHPEDRKARHNLGLALQEKPESADPSEPAKGRPPAPLPSGMNGPKTGGGNG